LAELKSAIGVALRVGINATARFHIPSQQRDGDGAARGASAASPTLVATADEVIE
jgi:hypothetical protein